MHFNICEVLYSCMVFADWKPSMKFYTHENLDQALVQWQNKAVCKYKNKKIAKS